MSLEARGKLGDALVAFVWKGRNILRAWTIPSNPRSEGQKLIRQKFAAMGKNTKAIKEITATLASGSAMYQLIKAVTPATQIWNAEFAKQALADLKVDATFVDFWSDITNDGLLTAWQANAAALGMVSLTGAPYATEIPPEIILAMGAYAAFKLDLTGTTSVYNTHPTNWTDAQVSDFATDYYTDT